MCDLALDLESELGIVAIRSADQTDPPDLLDGEGGEVSGANEPEGADPRPVGDGELLTIGCELPAGLLVLHTPVVMLELGIAFLARQFS